MDNQIAVVEKTSNTLTSIERSNLVDLEATIEKHLGVFCEVGACLMEIRDNHYYREEYNTFEAYCHERWGFNSSRARQLISAATVNDNLKSVTKVTLNERQARVLAPLSPERQREVFQRVLDEVSDGVVTARHLEEIAQSVRRTRIPRQNNRPKNGPEQPAIETSFKTAWDKMVNEIERENLNGWQQTDKSLAIQYIQQLLDMIMTSGIKTPGDMRDEFGGSHAS